MLIKDQLSTLLLTKYIAVYFTHFVLPTLLLDSVLKFLQTDKPAGNCVTNKPQLGTITELKSNLFIVVAVASTPYHSIE